MWHALMKVRRIDHMVVCRIGRVACRTRHFTVCPGIGCFRPLATTVSILSIGMEGGVVGSRGGKRRE